MKEYNQRIRQAGVASTKPTRLSTTIGRFPRRGCNSIAIQFSGNAESGEVRCFYENSAPKADAWTQRQGVTLTMPKWSTRRVGKVSSPEEAVNSPTKWRTTVWLSSTKSPYSSLRRRSRAMVMRMRSVVEEIVEELLPRRDQRNLLPRALF